MSGLVKLGLGIFTGGASSFLPYVMFAGVAGAAGMFAGYKLEHPYVVSAEAQRDQAQSNLKLITEDRDRYIQDATDCRNGLKRQNDQIEAMRLDLNQAEQRVAEADKAAKLAAADARKQLDKWKEQARAHPDQTSKISSIVRSARSVLTDQ